MFQYLKKIERKVHSFFIKPNSYKFSSEKLDNLLRIFYCVSLGLIVHQFSPRVTSTDWLRSQSFNWSWPVIWIDYFEEKFFIVLAVFFLTFFLCVLCIFFVRSIWIKILCVTSFFILLSIEFSFGKIGRSAHSWLFVFIVFSFIGNDKRKDQFFFHTAQFWVLMTYGLSGIHKLTNLFSYVMKFGFKNLMPVEKSIANRIYDIPNYNVGKALLQEVLSWPVFFSLFLWGLLIYFQISCLFVVFRPPLYRLWGILIILFHLTTVFMLQILFFYNMILVSLLLVENPYEIKFSMRKTICSIPGVPLTLRVYNVLTRRKPTS